MECLISSMEHADRVGDTHQVHHIARLLSGVRKKASPNLTTDGNGGDLRYEEQRLARWCDFCMKKFATVDEPQTARLIAEALSRQETAGPREELSGEIKKEEVVEAISNLKRHKAPGCDKVEIELMQSSPEAM